MIAVVPYVLAVIALALCFLAVIALTPAPRQIHRGYAV